MANIDIVVPCYNYGRFLEASVGSVLQQSIIDLRVLIIDDASSDDSAAIARRIASRDPRVSVVIHPKNKGNIATYNEGIAWAASEYFLLLSADDVLTPGALERAVAIMDKNGDVAMTCGDIIWWDDADSMPELPSGQSGSFDRVDLIAEFCSTATNTVKTPTAVVRTAIQKAIGGYNAALPHAADMEMWLSFALRGSVARLDALQAVYRRHASAMSNWYVAAMIRDLRQRKETFDHFFRQCDNYRLDGAELRRLAYSSLAREALEYGVHDARQGHVVSGIRLMRWALQLDSTLTYAPVAMKLLRIPTAAGWRKAWARMSGRVQAC